MTTLTAARRPLVSRTMTRSELLNEAEHVFVNPTPLIALMLAHLRGDEERAMRHVEDQPPAGPDVVNCPSCGAQLHLERNETESE